MDNITPTEWSVEIADGGREGTILYTETEGCVLFYREFGGGDVVAIISAEDGVMWNKQRPLSSERRREILERVAREVIRQKASTCRAEIDEPEGCIYIREQLDGPKQA